MSSIPPDIPVWGPSPIGESDPLNNSRGMGESDPNIIDSLPVPTSRSPTIIASFGEQKAVSRPLVKQILIDRLRRGNLESKHPYPGSGVLY